MASSLKKNLIDSKALTADFSSDWLALEPNQDEICFWLSVTSQHADTTLDAKIEHSPDKVNSKDLVSFTQQTGTEGSELKGIALPIMGFVRVSVTLTGTTKAATVSADMLYGTKG